ncbi:MAG: hypothetical protein A2096_09830 [Spirochaetes bacterium GWF1_41_5]|nr:MAG: hypothetical protein A2096_09830 [Spirochaetes bacterium GWF1_41_5]
MKLYGAGSISDVRKCAALGVKGILTNPQGFDQFFNGIKTLEEITEELIEATKTENLPVFIQIHGADTETIIRRARQIHSLSRRVGFKIISDTKGFKAIKILQTEEINCIATCLFTVAQAAIAANIKAFGICPFISRVRAAGLDPAHLVHTIKNGYKELENPPEIIAVSMKTVADIELAIEAGADAVGMRYPLLEAMMEHKSSREAELLFAKNWINVKGEDISYIGEGIKLKGEAE